jgi:hypothetical protein
MKRLLLILTVSATAAACSSLPPPPPPPMEAGPGPVAFDARQFAWSNRPGTASIRGTVSAAGYSCAGSKVVLTPDAPFSRQRIFNLYGSIDHAAVPVSVVRGRQVAKASGDYSTFVRTAECGPDNHFAFTGLPAGGWFIIVAAEPAGDRGEPMAMLRRVVIKKGELRTVGLQ